MAIVIPAKGCYVAKGKRPVFLTREQYIQTQRKGAFAARHRSLTLQNQEREASDEALSPRLPRYDEQQSEAVPDVNPPPYEEHGLGQLSSPSVQPPACIEHDNHKVLGDKAGHGEGREADKIQDVGLSNEDEDVVGPRGSGAVRKYNLLHSLGKWVKGISGL